MFGNNSQTHNNIFGGIQESHQRLFGGDRMLSTKDIEGAQPRKFHRHVWGNYQANSYQNIFSYEPEKSSIRSPILGDNVQPLNRGIPNSSGMLFRDFVPPSQGQKLNTVPSQITSQINYAKSPQQKQVNQTEPVQKVETIPYNQVKERVSQQNTLGFSNLMRDSQNQLYQLNQPIIMNQNSDQIIEKVRRRIEPPSQLREQNIFSLPEYKNSTVESQLKLRNNTVQVSSTKSANNQDILDKMRRFKEIQNYQVRSPSAQNKFNVLNNNRNPDSYIQYDPTPKEYKRDSISSYALGQLQDPVVEKYLPNKEQHYQQPSQSPVFKQNRNYGPDVVLKGPVAQGITSSSQYGSNSFKNYINREQEIQPSTLQNNNNIRPPSNKPEITIEQPVNPLQQSENYVRPPSNNIVNKYEYEGNQNIQQNNKEIMQQNDQRLYEDLIPKTQTLENNVQFQRPQSNKIEVFRPPSNNYYTQLRGNGEQLSNSAIIQYPQSAKNIYTGSNDIQRLRTVLSSRAKQLLNQGQIQQTSNGEYGLYAIYTNRNKQDLQVPVQKEKILYQSKRDNFLRSHLPRSQSAEGQRFQRGEEITNIQSQNIQMPKSPNTYLPKYGQWALRSYNIIGNYQYPYRYEGRKNDPYAEQKYLGSRNDFNSSKSLRSPKQNNYIQNSINPDIKHDMIEEFKKSGVVSSPIAGQQNHYAETNRQFNVHYHQQQQPEPNQVKFFSAKALKNLSNIKLY